MASSSDSRPSKLAIFVLCHKGGVGKTTWCRGYLDIARSLGVRIAAYDADGENGQLLQYYGTKDSEGKLIPDQDPLTGVGYFDIRTAQRDYLLAHESHEDDADVVLFDLPGGAVHELKVVLDSTQLFFETYRKAGFTPVVVIVTDQIKASLRTVGDTIEKFGDAAKYVVVLNTSRAPLDEFFLYYGFEDATGATRDFRKRGGKGREALLASGGEEIVMPGLQVGTYAKLDLDSLTFSDATGNKTLFPADRLRVVAWLEKFRESLAGSIIDPDRIKASAAAAESTTVSGTTVPKSKVSA